MPSRILLAWEAGAGRGHLVTLKTVAEALGDGFVYDAAICRMQYASELTGICDLVFPSAFLQLGTARRAAAGNPRTATWAEFLGDLGFADPAFLIRQIGWWIAAIKARVSSMVIADFAPCALLAARALNIPAVCVGTGYSAPPSGMPEFPILIPGIDTRLYAETELVEAVNVACHHFGMSPITRFADIYGASTQLPRTIPALDPYGPWRTGPLLPPLNETPPPADPAADEVFIYFSTDEHDDAPLMSAIANLGVPTRLYMPGVPDALAHTLSQAGVLIERQPLPITQIAARAKLMVHAGQHGVMCMALGIGLPQVAFPRHLEHLYHAQRTRALGTLSLVPRDIRDPDQMRATILAAYHDNATRTLARHRATQLRPSLLGDARALIRQQIGPLLA